MTSRGGARGQPGAGAGLAGKAAEPSPWRRGPVAAEARPRPPAPSAMAASAVPAIPAPLTGIPFLKASHVRLGAERWAPGSARQPFSHSQFPPFWGVYRPAPAPPPRSGRVLSPAGADGGETCSETRLAFPERPLQPVAPVVPPESHIRMHADPRIRVLASATRDSFPCPHTPLQRPPLPTAEKWKDNIPCGDREKIRLPPSVYTFSYPAREIRPTARPWHSQRGELFYRPVCPQQTFPAVLGAAQASWVPGGSVAWLGVALRATIAVRTIWMFCFPFL